MKKISIAALSVFMLILVFIPTAQAQTPQETLSQYISDLQKNPADIALREKIIKHVQTMSPAPALPSAVDELVGQAKYVFKHARAERDYLDAVEAYKKVVTLAPWVGDYYYNLAVAQEQAGLPQDAIKSFNLYLVASPDAKDAREVRERIGGLKYAAEKAAKESSPEAVAAKKQNEYETWLRNLDGARFIGTPTEDIAIGYEGSWMFLVYYINGKEVRQGWIDGVRDARNFDFRTARIRQVEFNDGSMSKYIEDKQFRLPQPSFMNDQRPCMATISDDGQFITVLCPSSSLPNTSTRVK